MEEPKKSHKPTSDVLEGILDNHQDDEVSVYEITRALHERGFGILLAFFSLPTSFPIVPPGVPTILAIPLLFFSIQMLMARADPWIPEFIGKRTIRRHTIETVIKKASPILRRIEKVLRPRLTFASTPKGERIIGTLCLLFCIPILLPLPLSNMLPSIGILVMSLGLLSKDGLLVIIGAVIGSMGIAVCLGVLFLGVEAIQHMIDWILP